MEIHVTTLNRCVCDITHALDKLMCGNSDLYYVYIPLDDVKDKSEHYIALRRPGRTIGHIEIGDDDIIVNISIYQHGESSFTEDTTETLKPFIGMKLERDAILNQ